MDANRRMLSRRSFVRVAGAALALGALTALPPRGSLAGWDVAGARAGSDGTGSDAGASGGEGVASAPGAFPTVEFGTYPQGANGEVEPIEWYVLKEWDGRRLLLSKHILDAHPYNEESEGVTWETCTLRAWLNADFIKEAFSADELVRINEAALINSDNPDFGTPGGGKTHDRVFCLSCDEVMAHFGLRRTWDQLKDELGDDWYATDGIYDYARIYAEEPGYKALVAYATDYAVSCGVYVWKNEALAEYDGGSLWWLRSPGCAADYAVGVGAGGGMGSDGHDVTLSSFGVRPALWLNP